MEHFIFPLLILIIAISQAVARARRESSDLPPRPMPPRPAPRQTESEAERQRRFMEAVGLPMDGPKPPQVRPRANTVPGPLPDIKPVGLPGSMLPAPSGRLRRVPPASRPPGGYATTPPPVKRVPAAPAPAAVIVAQPSPPPAPAPALASVSQSTTAARPPVLPASAAQPVNVASGLLLRLRDPAAIREAIILREILGPPKAFQAGF